MSKGERGSFLVGSRWGVGRVHKNMGFLTGTGKLAVPSQIGQELGINEEQKLLRGTVGLLHVRLAEGIIVM